MARPQPQQEPHEFSPEAPGNYSRDIALLHQTQQAHDRQITELAATMRDGFAATDRRLESLATSISASKAANWPLVISSIVLTMTLIGGGWTIVKMHTEGTVSPLMAALSLVQQDSKSISSSVSRIADVQQVTRNELASNTATDAASRDDRAHLNSSLDLLTRQYAENEATRREQNATTREKLTEIETQFRAADEARNLQSAEHRRTTALLWEQVFGARYPSDVAYYPKIGQSPASNSNGK